MDSNQAAISTLNVLNVRHLYRFAVMSSLWLYSFTIRRLFWNNSWPYTTRRLCEILLVFGWQACGVWVSGHVYLGRGGIFESELDLEDFNETARAYLYWSWVPLWVCSVRWLYCYWGLRGAFIHHINMQRVSEWYPQRFLSIFTGQCKYNLKKY